MGLDQYAYVGYAGQHDDYDKQDGEFSGGEWVTKGEVSRPQELAYWRKHHTLQRWMKNLWIEKGKPNIGDTDANFNCIELELTWDDIDRLEKISSRVQWQNWILLVSFSATIVMIITKSMTYNSVSMPKQKHFLVVKYSTIQVGNENII